MHNDPIDLTDVPDSNFIDQDGEYDVVITATEDCHFKTGSIGFSLKMMDQHGRTIGDRVVVDTATKWKLKQMAVAAGLSDTEMARFTHHMLRGKTVNIATKADGEYQRVIKYRPTDTVLIPPAPKVEDTPF